MPAGSPVLTSTLSFTSRRPPHLGIEDPLPGLVRLDVASVRFDGQRLSIALTAHRDDPTFGDVSQAVLLRFTIGNTIAADQGFGKAGMWVSPAADYRQFVTAAEVYGDRVAGVDGSRIVVFGILPDGSDLDATFGTNGVCTSDLGSPLTSPVATNDRDESIYVFARRETDLRCIGCRVPVRTPLTPVENGTIDPSFGDGGIAGGLGRKVFLQPDGSVICAFCDDDQIGLKRILPDGTTDTSFGMADQPVPGGGGTFPIGLRVRPPAALSVRGISPGGLVQMGENLYLIATATLGGDTTATGVKRPAFDFLVVTCWNVDGSPDTRFGDGGLQYGGVSPELANWSALGVLAESPSSVLAYGSASPIEVLTSIHADGTTTTSTLIRNPQPALFRVAHPRGIDFRFGVDGAAIMRMQEFFPARCVAGVVLPNGRVRLACVDTATGPNSDRPVTTFGGLGQFE